MKRKNRPTGRPNRQALGKPQISAMIWKFAGDFIQMGENMEKKQNQLRAACSAWNIACNRADLRTKSLDNYLREYRRFNPKADEKEIAGVRSDMEKLIEKKLEMFPYELRQVVDARIFTVGGQHRLEVMSARLE